MARIEFHVDAREEDDGTYWATVQELPGCFASGDDIAELQEAVEEAVRMCLPEGVTFDSAAWQQEKTKKARRRPALQHLLITGRTHRSRRVATSG